MIFTLINNALIFYIIVIHTEKFHTVSFIYFSGKDNLNLSYWRNIKLDFDGLKDICTFLSHNLLIKILMEWKYSYMRFIRWEESVKLKKKIEQPYKSLIDHKWMYKICSKFL